MLVLCSSAAPSVSVSAGLRRVHSETDFVVSLGVVSSVGAAAVVVVVSGSSGRLKCTFGISPIKMGSRSLRTCSRLSHLRTATRLCLHLQPPRENDVIPSLFPNLFLRDGQSRKSCPEQLFQILVQQVTLFYQYLVHLLRDFHKNKESTKNHANSTMKKKKKNSVPIVDFCESSWTFVKLLLLFVSIAAR